MKEIHYLCIQLQKMTREVLTSEAKEQFDLTKAC